MKKIFNSLLLLCSLLSASAANACWPLKERSQIEGFAELDGVLIISLKDAISCEPVANAKVMLGTLEYQTDAKGYVKLPADPFSQQMDAHMPLKASRSGYINLSTDLVIEAGSVLNRRLLLSPVLPPGKTRFVLQWGDEPQDLDLHLKGPDFHISYRNMKSAANKARLDVDEMEGYGPETITLNRINANSQYDLWVYNYSNDGRYSGQEWVYVYAGDRLVKEIRLPMSSKRSVHVLSIQNSKYNFINQAASQKP